MKTKKVESTVPEFIRLEKALIKAEREIGWKNLTAFIARWAKENQPSDEAYSLKYWMIQNKMI